MKKMVFDVLNEMADFLSVTQLKKLQEVMLGYLDKTEKEPDVATNSEYLTMFLAAKKIEGCSDRTIDYYKATVEHLIKNVQIQFRKMTTEDIRKYLADYQAINDCSKV